VTLILYETCNNLQQPSMTLNNPHEDSKITCTSCCYNPLMFLDSKITHTLCCSNPRIFLDSQIACTSCCYDPRTFLDSQIAHALCCYNARTFLDTVFDLKTPPMRTLQPCPDCPVPSDQQECTLISLFIFAIWQGPRLMHPKLPKTGNHSPVATTIGPVQLQSFYQLCNQTFKHYFTSFSDNIGCLLCM
jgi:hypothetical protein